MSKNEEINSIDPNSISQQELHGYLLSAVAPRPICFASTIDKDGNVNLSPFSYFNLFSVNPPIMIFSPSRRGRDNTTKHTLENVLEVQETVINIVNYDMVEQMSLSSTEYGDGVNEFVKAGFTQVPSDKVKPPRVGEAPVAFECVVDQVIALGDGPGAGNLVLAKVVQIHVKKAFLDAEGKLDTPKLDLVARMGGNWYCRANGDALFEIPKPIRTQGIGVDMLPEAVRNSVVLTGNNLGRLGNLEELPTKEAIAKITEHAEVKSILNGAEDVLEIHKLAQQWLADGKTEDALALLHL
ncbi:NADH-FMN oxidoreductase RutF, flavin reductase (DIM6/NTAB) family [Maribacter aquivivus]|uniref:NADH-FMN oxidoreductase RutF, flavin reductase (DIM6/NTAB) family n=1 Tax=Maribacter aquivivus TaxID=228958 RepID=A0A1M6IVT9_9FLAO|nr:flavin reductase family protein [Maribacter aquivivus]SHJ38556.1 NADH-FMN oxidoreductase RutF, flavin reductase (DIM6/NTAB) family [Maribacter aquivivus]